MSYFNTNSETGSTLAASISNAKNQEEKIVAIFENTNTLLLTPTMVHETLVKANFHYPITSVRRAITVLTEKRRLIKTDIMEQGAYNKQTHCWRLPVIGVDYD
tara:strand:- start:55 stop:363 length:309 start_codon:yes stop_codon:yes gene_type:complete